MTTFTDHVPTGGELEIVVIALSEGTCAMDVIMVTDKILDISTAGVVPKRTHTQCSTHKKERCKVSWGKPEQAVVLHCSLTSLCIFSGYSAAKLSLTACTLWRLNSNCCLSLNSTMNSISGLLSANI